jgi:hypothetical protein
MAELIPFDDESALAQVNGRLSSADIARNSGHVALEIAATEPLPMLEPIDVNNRNALSIGFAEGESTPEEAPDA